MELGEYLAVLRKRWLVILVLATIGAALGYASTATETPLYRSSSTVYLTAARGDTISELAQGSTYTSNLMETYVLLATKPVVLEPVIEDLQLGVSARTLARSVQADSPLNSYFIDITVASANPQRAADIANAVAAQLSSTVSELAPTASDGTAALKMTQVSQAAPALAPFSPRPRLTATIGLVLGLALGLVTVVLWAQLDTRVRTQRDIPQIPSRTVLGQVPQDSALRRDSLAVATSPHSPLAESYRRLRTNLQFLDASRPLRCVVVTSSLPGEGKSTTAINLALVMAEKGAKVLLVDADMRSPSVADLCGLEGSAGLSGVLIHEAELGDVVQPWQVHGLDVIAAGQIPPNPGQLVESTAMENFLHEAQERYDMVILDTAPLLAVTDAAILAHRTDGAIVVARSKRVRRPDLAEALASLDAVGAHVLGVLLNGAQGYRGDLKYGYGQTSGRSKRRFRRLSTVRPMASHKHVAPQLTPLGPDAERLRGEHSPFGDGDALAPTWHRVADTDANEIGARGDLDAPVERDEQVAEQDQPGPDRTSVADDAALGGESVDDGDGVEPSGEDHPPAEPDAPEAVTEAITDAITEEIDASAVAASSRVPEPRLAGWADPGEPVATARERSDRPA
ncbi:polysaccharide biosynthesis tyrosine autokinase [Actinotalea sp. M2MS4P-6]|uniref:polysaccharide biosynthesis tyrosine autokinase n=1 Tax=Actinotalea sp. M2MS4P-6 TaxID=2983762 RepID=UPI0021E3C80F|nr:polysaccharide biosynthesis tyrosine autokinase [Actinotalea sp. M2MS4P-6]MCV2395820.1 polysaccharide biosynthesis tyrosine autokinase [Actinotalea sp. M2MS4P-6]